MGRALEFALSTLVIYIFSIAFTLFTVTHIGSYIEYNFNILIDALRCLN